MSDTRKFVCYYCDSACTLIMEGMGERDDDIEFKPIACPDDGTLVEYWKEVDE